MSARDELISELEKASGALRDNNSTYFASANACQAGLDITVSWSDGEPGTAPQGAMLLALTWNDMANLALRYGRNLSEETLVQAAAAVIENNEDDVSVRGGGE